MNITDPALIAHLVAEIPADDAGRAQLVADAQAWRMYWQASAVRTREALAATELAAALRDWSHDVSALIDWRMAASSIPFAELRRRRAEHGPLAMTFTDEDRRLARIWAETGSTPSNRGAAA